MLDQSAPYPRQSPLVGCSLRRPVSNDVVVVKVGHRSAAVTVQPERHGPQSKGLEMDHESPTDERVIEPRQKQQPGRLYGSSGQDYMTGRLGSPGSIRAYEVHSA